MKKTTAFVVLTIAGCATVQPRMVGKLQDVAIYPRFVSTTQAIVNPLSLASIATLDIVPYVEVSPGAYSPISSVSGNTTTFGAADMLKLTQASPSIDPNRPFVLKKLKPNKNYRVFAKAYNVSNVLISLDVISTADICVTSNDAPVMATLPVYLNDTPFAASMAVTVSADGRFDYLKGTLTLLPGNLQVAVGQSSRNNADFLFNNLQANTDYKLLVEASKLGSVFASTSLTIGITNDNAPATQSLSISVPYLVSTFAGGAGTTAVGHADGVGTAAQFYVPYSLDIDGYGNLYVADGYNHLIRKITSGGVVSTLAGGAGGVTAGYADGAGTAAKFNQPRGLALDGSGNVYVVDFHNHLIRKITSGGVVSTFAGGAGGTIAGYLDGAGTAAKFNGPEAVAVDGAGNVYVADRLNNLVRKITSGGVVSTLAGGAGGVTAGYANGIGTAATFNNPLGIEVDGSGNVYVADFANHLIRKITSGGLVSTLAGGSGTTTAGHADGTGTSATFTYPAKVALDGSGNVYVADYGNHLIRRITSGGVVSTLAGGAGVTTAGYVNGLGTVAQFNYPIGVAVDVSGNVYVADGSNNLIRVLK